MAIHKEHYHGGRAVTRKVPPSLRALRLMFRYAGGVLPGLMGRWACAIWFRTRRFPESAAARKASGTARHETLQVGTIPLAVHRWGNGPVVLFLHGWSGRGSQVAAFIPPLLASGYQVVAPDAPGHGDTPGKETNIYEVARAVMAVCREYGPVHAAITHSFGGMVLACALAWGARVGRVVCLSAPADMTFLLQSFARTLSLHPRVLASLQQRIGRRFGSDYHERVSTVENVRNLTVPALIIHDENDVSVPWQQGARIAAAWPGARFLKTRGLGHGRILRDAETVAAAVEFITGR